MSLFDTIQKELERAGAAARDALDESKHRIDLFHARRLADDAAEALGYALHRARKEGHDLDPEAFARLDATLTGHADEVARLEAEIEKLRPKPDVTESPTPEPPAPPPTPGATS